LYKQVKQIVNPIPSPLSILTKDDVGSPFQAQQVHVEIDREWRGERGRDT
jgi:hypothetical protein